MAEHLALEQRRGDAAEVHFHKRSVGSLALSVDSLCDEFLARPALTRNQDGALVEATRATVARMSERDVPTMGDVWMVWAT